MPYGSPGRDLANGEGKVFLYGLNGDIATTGVVDGDQNADQWPARSDKNLGKYYEINAMLYSGG